MKALSEKEKMILGHKYVPNDKELLEDHYNAVALCREYSDIDPRDKEKINAVLRKLLSAVGEDTEIEAPFYCAYGYNISVGSNVYINSGVLILDCGKVFIDDDVMMGPSVQIYTVEHPTDAEERFNKIEFTKEVSIGKNAWIGGGAIILSGVSIGDNAVIGAGSVVLKDVPSNAIAAGNPCRILKKKTE